MNKTRIIDNKPAQTYSLTWIKDNLNNFINGALVSEWILADEYSENFVSPFWNGTEWIESATPEEIVEANKPKVPLEIAKMHLKIELIKRGLEFKEVEDTINAIPTEMFSEIDKKIAITKFNDAVSFDRYNADLQLVATLMGLTQEDLDEIFINGNL